MKLIRNIAFFLTATLLFLSCGKELSEENGTGSGNAVGTLKADASSGACLPSSVNGVFIAGTTLTASNFINVDVNIASVGAYSISSNIVNGYSFSGVGVATSTGVQTIRLNGTGTPTAQGANTFTITFGTSECDIVVDVYPSGTGNAVFSAIDCSAAAPVGTYKQGVATNSTNTLQVQATVTTAGLYNITTTAANAVKFTGSGFLATGTHPITLTADGGTPANAGPFSYTVTAGTNTCSFDVTYQAGTPPTGTMGWSFTAGGNTFSGDLDDAELQTLMGVTILSIAGDEPTGMGTITLMFTSPSGGITTGNYSGNNPTGKFFSFAYSDGALNVYSGQPGSGSNVTGIIDVYSPSTHVIQGRFSGSAKDGITGSSTIAITNGQFKANLP